MSSSSLKFGVLSTANIANKVCQAITQSTSAEVVAVASRSQEKADAFAEVNGIETAYPNYVDLLSDENVDAVYIPLPTTMKKEWALKAIEAGKHVLVEKPFASVDDVKEMRAAAEEKKVQFMDGTMFVHNVRPEGIKKAIDEKLGKVVGFSSGFTVGLVGEGDIRFNPKLEPMGAIGDLGWYNSKAVLVFNDWEMPEKVYAYGNSQSGVPKDVSVVMTFKDGKRYTFDCGFIGHWRQWFEINCENGQVMMDGFVLPYQTDSVIFPDNEYSETQEFQVITGAGDKETVKLGECVQEVQMIEDFVQAVQGNTDRDWGMEAEQTQMLVDAMFISFAEGKPFDL